MAKKQKQKKNVVASVTGGLEAALELSRAFERLLVDVFVAYVPLFAPVIPATIAFLSLYYVLSMPLWVSVIGAAVVEFLGLGTVSTTMQFMDYNASKNEDDPPAPTKLAVGAALFYLIVVLTVNVLLDESTTIHKVAKLLLSTLSVAGAVTISLRSQHARRVAAKAIKDAKAAADEQAENEDSRAYKRQVAAERRAQKHELKKLELELKASENKPDPVKVAEQVSETNNEKPATFGQWKTWRQLPPEEKLKIASMNATLAKRMAMETVVQDYDVSERVAYGWLEYAERDFGTPVNLPVNREPINQEVQS